jgi:hypothetical protein
MIMRGEDIEVAPTRVITIKTDTSVACDATVHLVINEGAQVLILEGPFLKAKSPISMSSHHGHVLKVAFTSFIANWTVVGVVDHEPFNDRCAKGFGLWIKKRDGGLITGWCHARHDNLSTRIFFILELLDGTLTAGAD